MAKLSVFSSEQNQAYYNEDQRNVHIWGLFQCGGETGMRDLIAGFYNHDNRVTYAMLYEWLDLIVVPLRTADLADGQARDWVSKGMKPRVGLARLYKLLNAHEERDPRSKDGVFPIPNMEYQTTEQRLVTHCIPRDDVDPCEPGHYIIFYGYGIEIGDQARGASNWQLQHPVLNSVPAIETSIFDANIKARNNKDDKRAATFRTVVRNRDKHCVITGTRPMKRERETDYTGLEAAHIFPIAWADVARHYLHTNKKGLIRGFVETHIKADRSRNGFLLRADIHRLFDQYVWSIYEDKVFFFEKARPDAMGENTETLQNSFGQFNFPDGGIDLNAKPERDEEYKPTSIPEEAPEPALMLFHFVCALHKNVVGVGRVVGGRKA